MRYHFNHLGPTQYNIAQVLKEQGWRTNKWPWRANFSDQHLDFDPEITECLEFKHHLADLIQPLTPAISPLTYSFSDEDWPFVLNQASLGEASSDHAWILKPALLNNAQDIKLFNNLDAVKSYLTNPRRLGGAHVLQHYLAQPHLLSGQRKYSIRMFLILTNYMGAFLYPNGYFNLSKHAYQGTDFTDMRPHLTNEHLFAEETNVIQIPSERFTHFPALYEQIVHHCQQVMSLLCQRFPEALTGRPMNQMALFGVDFIVDCTGKVWLLEFNHGPCFPVESDHPLQAYLYQTFWQHVVEEFVVPIAKKEKVVISHFYKVF